MFGQEYHKIDTLFKRDNDGTKKLIIGEYRSPAVEWAKDCLWLFTEKVDGTNVRVHWNGHRVSFGGRTDAANMPGPLMDELGRIFGGESNAQIFEQLFGDKEATIYGEGYGGSIQKGSSYRATQSFIAFDVMVGEWFLDRESASEIVKAFGCGIVPLVLSGSIMDGVNYVLDAPKSIVAEGDRIMEGIIGVPSTRVLDGRGKRMIVKIKGEDFQ